MNDELLDRYIFCEVQTANLDTLVSVLLDHSHLDWKEKNLIINDDGREAVMTVLKAIAPNSYKKTLRILKEEKENGTD